MERGKFKNLQKVLRPALQDCGEKGGQFLPPRALLRGEWHQGILQAEVGKAFAQVLEHAGVYKCTPEGREAFLRFIESVK